MNPAIPIPLSSSNPSRFQAAIRAFDHQNSQDPNREIVDQTPLPHELLYAQRLTRWVLKLCPAPSEELLLAARSQHLCRWKIPRSNYEMNRAGYLRWRNALKQFHARKSGEILRELGYPEEIIARVQDLNLKKHFPHDPETRVLEDALCLVFLEFQFADLAGKTTPEKMINALQKSWAKMTSQAREEALKLPFGPREKDLLNRALRS